MEVDTNVGHHTQNGTASPTGSSSSVQLEGEALEQAILKQVDYYFSRQNLSNDAYLVSQMNQQLFVPISVIAKFRAVAKLTSDEATIARVMRNSSVVSVDETGTMIKPNITNARNTIILRDIPTTATAEEIRGIFENKPNFSDTVEKVRPDVGGTWFVTFEGEPEALRALEFLRGETFCGNSIKARIKSENLLRQFFTPDGNHSPTAGATGYNPAQNPYYGAQAYGYYPYDPNYASQGVYDYRADYRNQRGGFRGGKQGRGGARDMQPRRPSPGAVPVPMQPGVAMVGVPGVDRGGRAGRPRKNSARKGGMPEKGPDGTMPRSSVQLGPAHFPPLPSKTMADSIGYGDTPFTRYSREEALKIMDDIREQLEKPTFMTPQCPIILDVANQALEAGKDKEDMEAERQRKDSNISTDGEYDEAEGMATILAGETPTLTAIPEAQAPKGFAAVVKSGNQTTPAKKPAPVAPPTRPVSAPNTKSKQADNAHKKEGARKGNGEGRGKQSGEGKDKSHTNEAAQTQPSPVKEDPNKPPSYAAMLKKKQAEQAAAASNAAAAAAAKGENGKPAEK